jgi:hypothetical protein
MIIAVIFFIILLNYLFIQKLEFIGKYYYKNPVRIYDIGFKYLPDLHKYAIISDIIVVLSLMCLFIPGLFIPFLYLIIPIWLIRFITISVTVLPKTINCNINNSIYSTIFGGCYDKIFSGHFAIVFAITLLLLEQSYISLFTTTIINVLNAILIISVRNHYTIDVIVSFFVTLCVYQFINTHKTFIKSIPL